jgi:hypothetical protein
MGTVVYLNFKPSKIVRRLICIRKRDGLAVVNPVVNPVVNLSVNVIANHAADNADN